MSDYSDPDFEEAYDEWHRSFKQMFEEALALDAVRRMIAVLMNASIELDVGSNEEIEAAERIEKNYRRGLCKTFEWPIGGFVERIKIK